MGNLKYGYYEIMNWAINPMGENVFDEKNFSIGSQL